VQSDEYRIRKGSAEEGRCGEIHTVFFNVLPYVYRRAMPACKLPFDKRIRGFIVKSSAFCGGRKMLCQ
jgi:hypothetical protein